MGVSNAMQSTHCIIIFLILFISVIQAADKLEFYVSPTGSDTNSGTSASQPFKTIGRVSDILASKTSATCTIYLTPGEYTSNNFAIFKNQLSVTLKTTESGKKASIICSPSPSSNAPVFQIQNLNSFEIRDLIVENCETDVIHYAALTTSTSSQTLSIYNSEFRNNENYIIYTRGVVKLLTMDNNLFENNKKQIVFNRFVSERVNFIQKFETSLTFTNSKINGGNYAFYLHFMNKIKMENCIFQNIVNTVIFYDISPQQKNFDNALSLSNCSFINCQSKTYAAAVYMAYLTTTNLLVSDIKSTSLFISNSNFQNNSAVSGGSIYIQNIKAKMDSVIFENSTSYYNGGAIEAYTSYLEIDDSTFTSNSATRGNGGSIDLSLGSQLYCDNCKFTDNFAIGGSSISCLSDIEFVVLDDDCIFENNEFLANDDIACNQTTITFSWIFWTLIVCGSGLVLISTIVLIGYFIQIIRNWKTSPSTYSNPNLSVPIDNSVEIEMEEKPSNVE